MGMILPEVCEYVQFFIAINAEFTVVKKKEITNRKSMK